MMISHRVYPPRMALVAWWPRSDPPKRLVRGAARAIAPHWA